jgi:hypothetical protein
MGLIRGDEEYQAEVTRQREEAERQEREGGTSQGQGN